MRLQATCVAIDGRGVLITGAPGSGKSSLALALIDRGAVLVGDDGVELVAAGARLHARAVPATAGLLEVRNVGLLRFDFVGEAPVALLLTLDTAAHRYVEAAEETSILGLAVPTLALFPDSPVLHLRAEVALRTYGLR